MIGKGTSSRGSDLGRPLTAALNDLAPLSCEGEPERTDACHMATLKSMEKHMD